MKEWNFLVVLRPTRTEMISEGPTPAEFEAVTGHFAYYSKLVAEGKMLLAGRTSGDPAATIGIGVLAADSLDEAQVMVDADPCVVGGVMTVDVQPFSIALFGRKGAE